MQLLTVPFPESQSIDPSPDSYRERDDKRESLR